MKDTNPSYWDEYTNLQFVKHKLIEEYLKGWFPKLGSWSGNILYIDTHAGKGRHKGGQEGSPLIALRTFLNHTRRDHILKTCKVYFIFIEADKENAALLSQELQNLGSLPKGIEVRAFNLDAFDYLKGLTDLFDQKNAKLAPCFVFVDPYGFKIPCDTLKGIKSHPNSEVLVTFIWRELDMAIRQDQPPMEVLNSVFGSQDWRIIRKITDFDARSEAAVKLLKDNIGAKWATYIRMLGKNQKTRYFLVHLTDHEAGRDLIKNVVWKCCPDVGYYVRKTDDPKQQYLIQPQPDLNPLKQWVIDKLHDRNYTWTELEELLRQEIWLKKHLWQVVKELKDVKRVIASNYKDKFSQKANPTFSLKNL